MQVCMYVFKLTQVHYIVPVEIIKEFSFKSCVYIQKSSDLYLSQQKKKNYSKQLIESRFEMLCASDQFICLFVCLFSLLYFHSLRLIFPLYVYIYVSFLCRSFVRFVCNIFSSFCLLFSLYVFFQSIETDSYTCALILCVYSHIIMLNGRLQILRFYIYIERDIYSLDSFVFVFFAMSI